MTSRSRLLIGTVLLLPMLAAAQSLPKPQEFYFDEDAATTREIVVVKGNNDATAARLLRLVERGDRNADQANAQLAHLAYAAGRIDTGDTMYKRSLARSDGNNRLHNTLEWNYGWDRYRNGDIAGALGQWSASLPTRGINPAWAPPTLALALWKLDRKTEALQWYAAAVRTQPTRWRHANELAALLPEWTSADRATLAEVVAAWQANPPAWP